MPTVFTESFQGLIQIELANVYKEHNVILAEPGDLLPKRISFEDIRRFVLDGVATYELSVSTNVFTGELWIASTYWDVTDGSLIGDPEWSRTTPFAASASTWYSCAGYSNILDVLCFEADGDEPGDFIGIATTINVTGGKKFQTLPSTGFIAMNISSDGVTVFPTFRVNLGEVVLTYDPPVHYIFKIKAECLADYYTKDEVDALIAGGGGGGATDLSTTVTVNSVTVNSSTGDDALINSATQTDAGILIASDKVKIDNIQTIGVSAGKNKINPLAGFPGYITNTGSFTANVNAKTSEFIPVANSTSYWLTGLKKNSSNIKYYALYDSAKAFVSVGTITAAGSGAMADLNITPSGLGIGGGFIRITLVRDITSFSENDLSAAQFEQGASATSYEAFVQNATTINGINTLFQSAGGGGLTGTISSGKVPVANSTSNFIDSPIHVNGSSLVVGGTSIINGSKLTVIGDISVTNGLSVPSGNYLQLLTGATVGLTVNSSGALTIPNLTGSGSRVVMSDASGNISASAAMPTPGGSNGQILFNNSGAFGGASNAYWDSTNNRIGINQASPVYSLDVNGTARIVTLPTITGATKALVKDPSTGQVSEQLFPSGSGWGLTGNSGTNSATNFFGTTDANALVGKVNNLVSFFIDAANTYNTFLGYQAGAGAGNYNVCIGGNAGLSATGALINSVLIGTSAGQSQVSGDRNLIIGQAGSLPSNSGSNQLNIGNVIWGVDCSAIGTATSGRISIGANAPNAAAILELSSTLYGFLPPRMTTTQRTTITAVEGLEVYDITLHKKFVFDGTIWQACW